MAMTCVIVVRDPDYSNEYTVIGGDEPGVSIIDVDLGSGGPEEYDEEWVANKMEEAKDWPQGARDQLASTLDECTA